MSPIIIPGSDPDDFEQLDEEQVRHRAQVTKSKSLFRLLDVANEWRAAGCTPVFIIMQEHPCVIGCFSEESFGKYIN